MTGDPIDDYLTRLARELGKRGFDDARTIEEARDHLVDAIEDGQRRGLSLADAEREALERFGAPEIVAAQTVSERNQIMYRLAAVLETMWHRKWWILAPTIVTAVATSVLSYYFLPTRYRSETALLVVAQRVPTNYVRPTVTTHVQDRLASLRQQIFSRTRLERIIADFALYETERAQVPMEEIVRQMRNDIQITVGTPDSSSPNESQGFNLSFVSDDPRTAQRVTERLASLFIEENLREREQMAEGTGQFIESQAEDVRRRIIEYEGKLEALRKHGQQTPSQADLLPYEVLKERYKSLLIMAEETRMTENLERRQIGEQFKLLDAPRLPERPVGPSRVAVNVAGTFGGLALGMILVGIRGRRKKDTPAT